MVYTYAKVDQMYENAWENYDPMPYKGRVVIIRGSKQPRGIYSDPTLGWGGLIEGELKLYEIPAYHNTILREPHVQLLAEKVRECLDNDVDTDDYKSETAYDSVQPLPKSGQPR